MNEDQRLNAEWVTLNAVRGVVKIAAKGDLAKATYSNALDFGGNLYPELLGPESSVLRRARESDTVKEYRQIARLKSIKEGKTVSALALIQEEIAERRDLLQISKESKDRAKVDQIKRRLALLVDAEKDLNLIPHSENQLIFRDATGVNPNIPILGSGKSFRDFFLPEENVLRIRVLHPEVPEHLTGADIIYERHEPNEERASIVVVQYKIWENKILYLNEPRMQKQLERLRAFTCGRCVCAEPEGVKEYRFPYCAGFLRPTDKLQRADQAFSSTGEHLPICNIGICTSKGLHGADILEYANIRDRSLSTEIFEHLFNKGRIGSRQLSYEELITLYKAHAIEPELDTVILYVQEFPE